MSRDLVSHAVPRIVENLSSLLPGDSQTTPLVRSLSGFVPEGTKWILMRLVARLNSGAGPKDLLARKNGSGLVGDILIKARLGELDPVAFFGTKYWPVFVELDDNLQMEIWWSNTLATNAALLRLDAFGR